MSETAVAADPRLEHWEAMEKAFATRDWEQFYRSAEALSAAAYILGAAGDPYAPILKEKPQRPAAPEPPKEWTVSELDASAIRFKQGSTLFTVIRPGGSPNSMRDIVAFCDTRENADLVARALSALKE